MQLAVTADLHIASHQAHGGQHRDGLNERGRICVEAFKRSIQIAADNGAAVYFAAGDIFNSWRPEPALVAAVQRVLEDSPIPVVFVAGNHDQQDASPLAQSTSLEPLQHYATLVREPQWFHYADVSVLCVSFSAETTMAEYLEKVLAQDQPTGAKPHRILITHVGVTDAMSPSWLKGKKDAMDSGHLLGLLARAEFDGAFVGNYHAHQIWKSPVSWIVQCGTLIPWNHSDEGLFPKVGGVALYTPDYIPTLVEVPGPRFLTLKSGEELPPSPGNQLFVRSTSAVVNTSVAGLDIVEEVPKEELKVSTQQVDSSEEALVEYAKAHNLPDEVLELAKSFWVKAA